MTETIEIQPEWHVGKLAKALADAQLEFRPVKKDTENPYFSSKYADLSSIIAATQPALAKHGIAIIQKPIIDLDKQKAGVYTKMVHASGEYEDASLLLPALMKGKDGAVRFDAQSIGSAITYARRYSYQAMVGVAAEFDDDGNAAVGNGSKEAAQAVAKRKVDEYNAKKGDTTEALTKSIEAAKQRPLVEGLICSVQGMRKKDGASEYRRVEVMLPDDSIQVFACFGDHAYPDGSTTFSLLDLIGDTIKETKKKVHCSFHATYNGKFANIERFVILDQIKFDDDGVPFIEREAAKPVRAEIPALY